MEDNLSIWTPSSTEILHSITRSFTVRNGLSTGKAFQHLVELLTVQLYRYNAKMVLCFWALHSHPEDDWLLGCLSKKMVVYIMSCFDDFPQDVAEGGSIQTCPGVDEQMWM